VNDRAKQSFMKNIKKVVGILRSWRKKETATGDSYYELMVMDDMEVHRIFLGELQGPIFFEQFKEGDLVTIECSQGEKGLWANGFGRKASQFRDTSDFGEYSEKFMAYQSHTFREGGPLPRRNKAQTKRPKASHLGHSK
jgi:hypothetical protein